MNTINIIGRIKIKVHFPQECSTLRQVIKIVITYWTGESNWTNINLSFFIHTYLLTIFSNLLTIVQSILYEI